MTFFGELLIESCNRQVSQKVRGVLPRFSVANPLLAQNVMDRFVYGMTVGTISARTGIGKGTLFSEYARLSERRISEVRSGVRDLSISVWNGLPSGLNAAPAPDRCYQPWLPYNP